MTPTTTHDFLDAGGEACGTVTPLIRQALTPLEPGHVLEVLTNDAATRAGVPAWCRLTGHQLIDTRAEDAQRTRFWIRKSTATRSPAPNPA